MSVSFHNKILRVDLTEGKISVDEPGVVYLRTYMGGWNIIADTLLREVRANSGYLSGDPARLHFGLPQGAELLQLEIEWPDGARSVVSAIEAAQHLEITRTTPPIEFQEMRS